MITVEASLVGIATWIVVSFPLGVVIGSWLRRVAARPRELECARADAAENLRAEDGSRAARPTPAATAAADA